jgi:hypothetical protein
MSVRIRAGARFKQFLCFVLIRVRRFRGPQDEAHGIEDLVERTGRAGLPRGPLLEARCRKPFPGHVQVGRFALSARELGTDSSANRTQRVTGKAVSSGHIQEVSLFVCLSVCSSRVSSHRPQLVSKFRRCQLKQAQSPRTGRISPLLPTLSPHQVLTDLRSISSHRAPALKQAANCTRCE